MLRQFFNSTLVPYLISDCASPVLQFYVGSVPEISAIVLRQFFDSSLVPYDCTICTHCTCTLVPVLFTYCIETLAFALRQFSHSTLVRFSQTSHICDSPLLRFYAGFALEIVPVASVFRQFFDSMLVRICFAGFANSSILSLVPLAESCTRSLCRSSRRYSVFKVYIFQALGLSTSLLVTLKYTPSPHKSIGSAHVFCCFYVLKIQRHTMPSRVKVCFCKSKDFLPLQKL